MSFSRRAFLQSGASSAALGAVSSSLFTPFAFAKDASQDTDPKDVKVLTQGSGCFDLGYTEELNHQINWTYVNSEGVAHLIPLLPSGSSVTHPTNSLLSWNFEEGDQFDHTDRYSQVDEKYLTLTRRNKDTDDFQSMGIFKRNDEKLELLGVVTEDSLLNDENFSLPYVNAKYDTFVFHAALENFSDDDAVTFTLVSQRLFVVMAINKDGMPRILYYLDKKDENNNTFDAEHPELRFVDGFRFSFPRFHLTNDNKYTIAFQSYTDGFYLFNMEADGLKLVSVLNDGGDPDEQSDFVHFPEHDYTWKVKITATNDKPADAFLQPLYNMGPNKETLMHWRTNDGHHVFVALHKNESGQYVAHPRALLRDGENIANSTWMMRPTHMTTSSLSPSHGDAPDKLVMWNLAQGCAFLSLEPKDEDSYQPHVLRHMATDETFQHGGKLAFALHDEFFAVNQTLTPNRRKQNALTHSATKPTHLKSSDSKNDDVLYRVHLRSPTRRTTNSVDFVQGTSSSSAPLLGAVSGAPGVSFVSSSAGLSVGGPNDMGGGGELPPDAPEQTKSGAQRCAANFWNFYKKNVLDQMIGKNPDPMSKQYKPDLDNQISEVKIVYKDHYNVSDAWLDAFAAEVYRLAQIMSDAMHEDEDRAEGKVENSMKASASMGYIMGMVFGGQMLIGIFTGIYGFVKDEIYKKGFKADTDTLCERIGGQVNRESLYSKLRQAEIALADIAPEAKPGGIDAAIKDVLASLDAALKKKSAAAAKAALSDYSRTIEHLQSFGVDSTAIQQFGEALDAATKKANELKPICNELDTNLRLPGPSNYKAMIVTGLVCASSLVALALFMPGGPF